ncbi:hypothetical protein ACFVDH_30255 [Streptomyces sp. NPDC057674]|uniref:hypothetical protein n=1 Tax=Streptomyces sp. NPDC057674 TaxID=3346203 RepID=UPI0036956B2A
MAGRSRLRAWGTSLGVLIVILAALTGCAGPYQYYGGTRLHDATTAEVAGFWENAEGTHVALLRDGTALLENLDGQDFDFEDGWRLSGTGTWQLTDDDGGQAVRLSLTTRTRVEKRSPAPVAAPSAQEPPSTYSWFLYVDRDQRDGLVMFFMYGDPDIGNMYVMTRKAGA